MWCLNCTVRHHGVVHGTFFVWHIIICVHLTHFLKSWRTVSSPLVSQADQDNAIDLLFCCEWRVGLLSEPLLNSIQQDALRAMATRLVFVSWANTFVKTSIMLLRAAGREQTCDLEHHVWVVLLQSTAVCVSSSLWLKVNRRIKAVFILRLVTVVILSALDRNAAQVLFGCLENITHASPAEVWKPLLIMRLWDVIFQSV